MKTIYVNCGVKNYLKEDHRSYICKLNVDKFIFIGFLLLGSLFAGSRFLGTLQYAANEFYLEVCFSDYSRFAL